MKQIVWRGPLFSLEMWERDGFDDIERLVARALNPTATPVALGKRGEHRGAERKLTTEENWREELARLAKKAKLIIVIPSFHEGTLWGLRLVINNGWLGKAIFIRPPSDERSALLVGIARRSGRVGANASQLSVFRPLAS